MEWKGSGTAVGWLSKVGFGLFFGGTIGICIVPNALGIASSVTNVIGFSTTIIGWIIVALGYRLDWRAVKHRQELAHRYGESEE